MRYTIGDTSKLMTFAPTLNGLELQPLPSCVFKRQSHSKTNGSSMVSFFVNYICCRHMCCFDANELGSCLLFFIHILMISLTWLLQLEKCRKLVQIAEKSLEEGTCYFYGIEACNEVLDGHGRVIGPTLRHECLCIRAALLLKVS